MGGLIEPSPLSEKRDWRPVYFGVVFVVAIVGTILFFCAHGRKSPRRLILTPPTSSFLT